MADAFPADIEEVDVVVVDIRGEFFSGCFAAEAAKASRTRVLSSRLIGVRLADTGGLAIH